MIRKKYQQLGLNFMSYLNCIKLENNEWKEKWEDEINKIIDSLPHGSGIDDKTEFNFEESKKHKLIINSGYHRMDENGFYDYDIENDSLFFNRNDVQLESSIDLGNIILDMGVDGSPVGFEILHASKMFHVPKYIIQNFHGMDAEISITKETIEIKIT